MIPLEDRQRLARDIQIAREAGARLGLACDIGGIDERTLQRWKADGGLIALITVAGRSHRARARGAADRCVSR